MSPVVGLHATNPKCRDSIRRIGLLASMPFMFSNTGRYLRKGRTHHQPYGLYVYSLDGSFDHPTFGRGGLCIWGAGPGMDVWQVAYIGPLYPDPFVQNAMVFSNSVPPQHVTLITHITGNHT